MEDIEMDNLSNKKKVLLAISLSRSLSHSLGFLAAIMQKKTLASSIRDVMAHNSSMGKFPHLT